VPDLTPHTKRHGALLPALIAAAGYRTALRFLEFLTVNSATGTHGQVYARAAATFLQWCEGQATGELERVHPVLVAAYIELLARGPVFPDCRRAPRFIWMPFDWLVTGQLMPSTLGGGVIRWRRASSEEATGSLTGMNISTGLRLA